MAEAVFTLTSKDSWKSAEVTKKLKFGKVYLTTGVVRKNKVYVMHSNLKTLMLASKDDKSKLNQKAIIQQIGNVD